MMSPRRSSVTVREIVTYDPAPIVFARAKCTRCGWSATDTNRAEIELLANLHAAYET